MYTVILRREMELYEIPIRNYFTLPQIGTVVHFRTTCLLPQLNRLAYFFIKSPLCKIVTFSHEMGFDI